MPAKAWLFLLLAIFTIGVFLPDARYFQEGRPELEQASRTLTSEMLLRNRSAWRSAVQTPRLLDSPALPGRVQSGLMVAPQIPETLPGRRQTPPARPIHRSSHQGLKIPSVEEGDLPSGTL
ncbi:MAG: hypothetical protein HYY85_03900 [Deltaproteobacteria bacterium]|nr:hypothetical protein [Deltaproteobacteria bacterium]